VDILTSYNNAVAGRPLILVVNANRQSNPLAFGQNDLNGTLADCSGRCNVLGLNNFGYQAGDSYAAFPDDLNTTCFDGFFYRQNVLAGKDFLFYGVSDYILMGGSVHKDMRWALSTLLMLKLGQLEPEIADVFKPMPGLFNSVARDTKDINSMGISNEGRLRVHLIMKACYANFKEITDPDKKVMKQKNVSFDSWRDIIEKCGGRKNAQYALDELLEQTVPQIFYQYVRKAKLNTEIYVNGELRTSGHQKSPLSLKLYFWSSIAEMRKHFA
jgi:hypothetical protein